MLRKQVQSNLPILPLCSLQTPKYHMWQLWEVRLDSESSQYRSLTSHYRSMTSQYRSMTSQLTAYLLSSVTTGTRCVYLASSSPGSQEATRDPDLRTLTFSADVLSMYLQLVSDHVFLFEMVRDMPHKPCCHNIDTLRTLSIPDTPLTNPILAHNE